MDTLCFPVKREDHFMFPAAMFRTPQRPTHGGIDCTPVAKGRSEPFYAFEDGIVTIADHTAERGDLSGLDVMVLGDRTRIRGWGGHLAAALVFQGQRVKKGQLIGYTGSTGNSSGAHLHFEMHYPGINDEIDPWDWLWDAPDVDGSTMPLAPSRDAALRDYPNYIKPGKTPAKTQDEIEEDEIVSIYDKLTGFISDRIETAESRMRADTRGFITLDMGDDPQGDIVKAAHAVYIGQRGVLVFEPPAKAGTGQIDSHVKGTESKGSDYRLVDQKRPVNRMTSGKFWNNVKDSLTAMNYDGDDRQWTVEEAQAWVAKHEALKAQERAAKDQAAS